MPQILFLEKPTNTLLRFLVARRQSVIRFFQIGYFSLGIGIIATILITKIRGDYPVVVVEIGKEFGTIAALCFLLTITPGILGRFRFRHSGITLAISFRRYVGILTFLFGLTHAVLVFALPYLFYQIPLLPLPDFMVFGALSLLGLFPLFLTSNDRSVKLLGKGWKRLHRLVYVIIWTIMIHVALQGEKSIEIAFGIIGVLEILSLIYNGYLEYQKTHKGVQV